MPLTYKAPTSKYHLTQPYYKLATNMWKHIYNMYYKDEEGWHPVWTYKWEALHWKECSEPCGGGIQYRDIRCRRSDDIIVHNAFCDIQGGKPNTSQACNTHACYWANYLQFRVPRRTARDWRQQIGHMNPGHVAFHVLVTDLCWKSYCHVYLEAHISGHIHTLWDMNAMAGICSNYRTHSHGERRIYVPNRCILYMRVNMGGANNCCRGVELHNIRKN